MSHVVKFDGETFRVDHARADHNGPCSLCHFKHLTCPTTSSGGLECMPYGIRAYFVAEPTANDVVLTSNEDKTYTRDQVISAVATFFGRSDGVALADYMDKVADPEYAEYLRLRSKFADMS